MALLEVKQDIGDAAVVVSVSGEVDAASFTSLVTNLDTALKAALDHPAHLLVLDMSQVTYFGSAGLNAILECYEEGSSMSVSVRIVAPNPEVTRPITVTRLDGVLRPYPTVADAIGAS